jgi:hypothetical protein
MRQPNCDFLEAAFKPHKLACCVLSETIYVRGTVALTFMEVCSSWFAPRPGNISNTINPTCLLKINQRLWATLHVDGSAKEVAHNVY